MKSLLGLALVAALVQPAPAYQFAVWLDGQTDAGGNGIPTSLVHAFGPGSVTLVTTAQLETPGFLSPFDAVVISRHGSDFGGPLSSAAAAFVASYVGSGEAQGGVAIFANDLADNLFGVPPDFQNPFDPNLDQLFVNAATAAASSHHGFIGEFNGAVMAMSENDAKLGDPLSRQWPALNLLVGRASFPVHVTNIAFFIWDVGPIGGNNPIDAGVSFPFTDSDTTLYRTDIFGASSNNIVDIFDDDRLPALLANTTVSGCASKPCTTVRFDPIQGCQYTAVTDGMACDDDNVCNGHETCHAGTCTAGTPLNCDENKQCQTDTCDPVAGCQHAPVLECCPSLCGDGKVDAVCGETCDLGSSLNGAPQGQESCCDATCHLQRPTFVCRIATSTCVANSVCATEDGKCPPSIKAPDDQLCSSKQPCTVDDHCQDGSCVSGTQICKAEVTQAEVTRARQLSAKAPLRVTCTGGNTVQAGANCSVQAFVDAAALLASVTAESAHAKTRKRVQCTLLAAKALGKCGYSPYCMHAAKILGQYGITIPCKRTACGAAFDLSVRACRQVTASAASTVRVTTAFSQLSVGSRTFNETTCSLCTSGTCHDGEICNDGSCRDQCPLP
jgi:hypothetical protein